MEVLAIIAVLAIASLMWFFIKRKNQRILKEGYHTKGIVVEYKTRFVRVGGEWTWLKYPYVEYLDQDQRCKIDYVKYANSYKPPFYIGQEIEIVKFRNVLYYKPIL